MSLELLESIKPKGNFQVEHYDKDGNLKGTYKFPNGVTNAGKDHWLSVTFNGGTAVNPWYLGLINESGYTALAAGDTMSSHTGWAEFTSYTESTRVDWGEDAPSSQSITNSTPATFTISSSGTLKGIFVTSNSTKGGTTGTLWATALFSSDVPVASSDLLKVTYTVTAA
jgi:hypothetical protein